jgi:hypothetical protein
VDNPKVPHRSRCESPISSRVVVEISYNIQAVDNKHNLVVHTINRNDLNALELSLGSKKKIWARYFTVLWIKATIMEGNAQCINNNITIVAHPTPGRSKESVTQPEYL